DGQKAPEDEVKKLDLRVILMGDKYTVKMGDKVIDRGTGKADPTKDPKTTDIVPSEGPSKGKTILAIYEVKGATLRMCYNLEGKAGPTAVATKEGSGLMLVVYQREKK